MNCVWTLVHLHNISQFNTFQGNHQSLSQWNVCAAHVNNFSSNLVECVEFSDLSGATVSWFIRFFRINNIELKCSFVRFRNYHKSWWNGAAELHISVTLWHNGRRATQPRRFTLWHNGHQATQLSKFTLWHNGRRAKHAVWGMHQESHTFPKIVTTHTEKYEGLIESKILLRVLYFSKPLKDECFQERMI